MDLGFQHTCSAPRGQDGRGMEFPRGSLPAWAVVCTCFLFCLEPRGRPARCGAPGPSNWVWAGKEPAFWLLFSVSASCHSMPRTTRPRIEHHSLWVSGPSPKAPKPSRTVSAEKRRQMGGACPLPFPLNIGSWEALQAFTLKVNIWRWGVYTGYPQPLLILSH